MHKKCPGRVWAVAGAALLLGGCASTPMSTGLTQLSADTYRISRIDGVGQYPDAAALKAAVVDEANAFARTQGKVAVPISSHQETMRAGHLSTADYEFRLAAPGELAPKPEAAAPVAAVAGPKESATASAAPPATAAAAPAPAAQAAAAPTAAAAAAVPAAAASRPEPKPDLYNELVMLDDLRKRGILTDAEFQALKTKLLAGR